MEQQHADETCQQLVEFCRKGWPSRSCLRGALKSYLPVSNELTVHNGLLLRGNRLVIPTALRQKSSRKFTLDTLVLQNAERGLDIQYGGLDWDESWRTLSANALSVASTSYSMLNPCVQVAFLIIHGRNSEQICSSGNRQHTCS